MISIVLSEGVEGIKMKKNITGIEFIDPKISISWELKEEDLVNMLKCEKKSLVFTSLKQNFHL